MNNLPEGSTAQDFAKYIAENKPHLIEIEEEIQNYCRGYSEGKLIIEVHIRGHNPVKVRFLPQREWNRSKLT